MLGRSLKDEIKPFQQVLNIPVDRIMSNPYQPRKVFSQAALQELAASIKEYGVLQPISVRRASRDTYELVAGERRLRAVILLGQKHIPAIVSELNDEDSAVLAMVENLQREDLGFMEEAEGYYSLLVDHGFTQEELAGRVGKSQSAIANKIRLLKLSPAVKKMISSEGLSERQARSLLRLPNEELQLKVAKMVGERGFNVKKTEELVRLTLERLDKPGIEPFFGKDDLAIAIDRRGKAQKVVKNIRIFINTIKETINLLKLAGVDAKAAQFDRGDYFEFIIRIPKRTNGIDDMSEDERE